MTLASIPLSGAFGYFEVTHDISKFCKAKVFSHVGKRSPIAVRFSTVGELIAVVYELKVNTTHIACIYMLVSI